MSDSGITIVTTQDFYPQIKPSIHPAAANQSPHGPGSEQQTPATNTNPTKLASEVERPNSTELSKEERKALQELKSIDREVRAHEAAHKAAAGGLTKGAATFSYQRGSDGQQYAIGGEVSIDVSEVAGDPQATLQKANTILSAALAPAQPSSQDHAVAAMAAQMAAEARMEMLRQRQEENSAPQDPVQADTVSRQAQQATAFYEETQHHTGSISTTGALLNLSG